MGYPPARRTAGPGYRGYWCCPDSGTRLRPPLVDQDGIPHSKQKAESHAVCFGGIGGREGWKDPRDI